VKKEGVDVRFGIVAESLIPQTIMISGMQIKDQGLSWKGSFLAGAWRLWELMTCGRNRLSGQFACQLRLF
jgi:hypothetical protein